MMVGTTSLVGGYYAMVGRKGEITIDRIRIEVAKFCTYHINPLITFTLANPVISNEQPADPMPKQATAK